MDFTPFRHRDFRLLYAAQTISLLGSMLTYVALPYQMYARTGSSLAVGLLGLAELVPLLITAFVGGALADAVDRRRMVMATDIALGAGTVVLATMAHSPATPVWALYAMAAYMSAFNGLQRPSIEALTPRFVERDEIPAAAALALLRGSVGMMAGPALGGILLASVGPVATYALDGASYLIALLCFAFMRPVPPGEHAERPGLSTIVDGLRYARSRQELIGTYLVDIVAMVFGMPFALFPAIAERLGGASVLGLLYAAPAAGAFVASLTSGWTRRVHRHGLAIMAAASIWGVAIVLFGLCDQIVPAAICLAIAGGADGISGIFRLTMWNQTIPDSVRGRMAAIEIISYTSGPLLGHAEAGVAAAWFGVRTSVVSGGVLCVVGVGLCALLLPRFVTYDARRVSAEQAA